MNRTEELMNMKGKELIEIALGYGLVINTNKERTQLKETKKAVVEKIVKHESDLAAKAAEEAKKAKQTKKKDVRVYEYNGEVKTINQWAKEVGISASTLYNRLVKAGLSPEEAFTKEVRKKRA